MSLKSMIQDMKDELGSISLKRFEVKLGHSLRSRSQRTSSDRGMARRVMPESLVMQSHWATMPPELLREVLAKIEEAQSVWPPRKHVVACAGVCRSWRDNMKEIVRTLEASGKITFPISVKQPGSRDNLIQCFIKRDRAMQIYQLYMGLTQALTDDGKFLLAARKFRRPTCTDYIISLDSADMSKGSGAYVGKLRSNFLGTKFTVYDAQPPHSEASSSKCWSSRFGTKQVSPRAPIGNYLVAHISYELNVLGSRGPRRMHCVMDSIPASSIEPGGVAPTPIDFSSNVTTDCIPSLTLFKSKCPSSENHKARPSSSPRDRVLVLKNKAPRWHEQLQCWCLNFRGRVTVASVKNFQLVASVDEAPAPLLIGQDQEKVLLQFGKVGKDLFTMDFRYPISAFQAFAICLSSFDTKIACE